MSSLLILLYAYFSNAFAQFNPGGPASFDCPMRELALNYAQAINPHLTSSQLSDIADALNGSPEAKNCSVKIDKLVPNIQTFQTDNHNTNNVVNVQTIYVDINNGIDDFKVSKNDPFKTLEYAVNFARIKYGPNKLKQILLKKGTYYLPNTIYFTPNDSNLIIRNYKNDKVIISGGIKLNCSWSVYKNDTKNGLNYYQCDLNTKNNVNVPSDGFTGLRMNGVRAIRARYPNANPEYGFGSTLKPIKYLPKKVSEPNYEYILNSTDANKQYLIRNDTLDNWFAHYTLGIDGVCDNFSPSIGYWCSLSEDLDHGGTYGIITGLQYNQSILPHTPYQTNISDYAVINMWRSGHWSSWMFKINDINYKTKEITFGIGGFQGARGGNKGDEFYIENVFEELDYGSEWFYNQTTKILYFRSNVSNQSPDNIVFEITNLKILFNYTGNSMKDPVKNITISGLTFKDAAITYLDPHAMPSGGDWALQRQGGLLFSYTENINIFNNYFTRMDGIAISINRYARNFNVYSNEFVWIGDSCITSFGDTVNSTTNTSTYGMGIDGTNGNQPRGLNISYNIAHEFSIFEKQSAFYFNAKSCYNNIHNNIVYNTARAAIVFNDGFGGGSSLYNNLLFNTCRESGAQGPFNSWDRQPYLTLNRSDANATPTTIKEYDSIYKNFIIGNYLSHFDINNDDGSCYYNSSSNFLVYAGVGLKGFTVAHDNHHYNNIYGYVLNACFDMVKAHGGALSTNINWFFNNICVLNSNQNNYAVLNCSTPQNTWPMMYNNSIYAPSTSNIDKMGLCDMSEINFQKKYNTDLNTIISTNVNDSWLIQQAKNLIFY